MVVTTSSQNCSSGAFQLSAGSTWQSLGSVTALNVASGVLCCRIRISAPSVSTNSANVLCLESNTTPSGTAGAFALPATATGINYVLVDNPKNLWFYGTSGDIVEYCVQGIQMDAILTS
jgi:hypothetical protein